MVALVWCVRWCVTADLQPPQRGAGRVLDLIKQLVLSKGEDGNQLSSAHRQTHSQSGDIVLPLSDPPSLQAPPTHV